MRTPVMLLVCLVCHSAFAAVEQREFWESSYQGQDATGSHVLGLWSFDAEDLTLDRSSHARAGKLENVEPDAEGRFGACLRSFRGWPLEDKRHRLVVRHDPILCPPGPFTLEMWINADQEIEDYPDAFLLDKKYVSDNDYQLILQRAGRSGQRTLKAVLGFGARSATWYSQPLQVVSGTWYHLVFSYDAAGTGRFFVNGQLWGAAQVPGVDRVTAGTHPLSIGDRVGSLYHGFPGRIDEVRITSGAREFRRARLERASDRSNFLRMEPGVSIRFDLCNCDRQDLRGAQLQWGIDGHWETPITVSELAPGQVQALTYTLNTALRPDVYRLEAQLQSRDTLETIASATFDVRLVPRRIPDRMPVVMWGAGPEDIDRLQEIGFTHALGIGADYQRIWEAGHPVSPADAERVQATRRALDQALAVGVDFAASLSPRRFLQDNRALLRVGRDQQPYQGREDICGWSPQVRDFYRHVGQSVAEAYGDLPAFSAALLNTEVRDAAQLCFHEHDQQAYREASGADIPDLAKTKWGVKYQQVAEFPQDRAIADTDPLYQFYSWYWKQGDGWNQLNTELHRGLATIHRSDFWTWHDPAVRVASVYGSGGQVDVISQWTYSYPDPIRIGVATDELLAMARGAEHSQQVMKMTQVIWYRSQTAPQPNGVDGQPAYQARWERQQPDAPFITIAPMHLREAFWTKIARPITGIMYHGWQSLVPTEGESGYRYTHTETARELQRLIETVVRPLGPTLRHVTSAPTDVAYYESFAAQMFAGRGTYGWSGKWSGDGHLIAQWAGLQVDVVYDETIRDLGLEKYKLLFAFDCDVIPQSAAQQIRQFQARGGLVIGDENTAPAIRPDITLTSYQRTGDAARDKAELLRIAQSLREQIAQRYKRYVDVDNPEVVPYRRRSADTDYVFLINDHRQSGQYVGHHGRVMEDGLPSQVRMVLRRSQAYVYDLVRHEPVACRSEADRSEVDIQLGPGEGRLLMIAPQAIAAVRLEVPDKTDRGRQVSIRVTVVGENGEPLKAVVPIALTIEDSEARQAEFSGYWAAVDGRLQVTLDLADNDSVGVWTIGARELASGRSTTSYLTVQGAEEAAPVSPVDPAAGNPVQPNG